MSDDGAACVVTENVALIAAAVAVIINRCVIPGMEFSSCLLFMDSEY